MIEILLLDQYLPSFFYLQEDGVSLWNYWIGRRKFEMVLKDKIKLGSLGSIASILGLLIAVYLLGQDTSSDTVVVISNEPNIETNIVNTPQTVIQKASAELSTFKETVANSPNDDFSGIEVDASISNQVTPAPVTNQTHEYRPDIETQSTPNDDVTQNNDVRLSASEIVPEEAESSDPVCKSVIETSIPGVTLRLSLTPNRNSIQKGYVVDSEQVELLRGHQEGMVTWYMINKPPNTSGWIEAKYVSTNCPI